MKNKIISKEPFNTCNSWGFGGGVGTITTYLSGHKHRRGKAYFRHLSPERIDRYFDPNGREIGKTQFEKEVAEWGT